MLTKDFLDLINKKVLERVSDAKWFINQCANFDKFFVGDAEVAKNHFVLATHADGTPFFTYVHDPERALLLNKVNACLAERLCDVQLLGPSAGMRGQDFVVRTFDIFWEPRHMFRVSNCVQVNGLFVPCAECDPVNLSLPELFHYYGTEPLRRVVEFALAEPSSPAMRAVQDKILELLKGAY